MPSVARWSPAVIAVRFIIVPLGKASNNFGTGYSGDSFQHYCAAVNVPSVLRGPTERSTLGRSLGEWLVLRIRARRCHVGSARAALETVSLKTRFWRYHGL